VVVQEKIMNLTSFQPEIREIVE